MITEHFVIIDVSSSLFNLYPSSSRSSEFVGYTDNRAVFAKKNGMVGAQPTGVMEDKVFFGTEEDKIKFEMKYL